MPEPISVDEWLAELQSLGVGTSESDALTVEEMVELLGRSNGWIRRQLRRGLRDGRIERTTKAMERIDGRLCTVPAYRLKPQLKPARKKR